MVKILLEILKLEFVFSFLIKNFFFVHRFRIKAKQNIIKKHGLNYFYFTLFAFAFIK